MGRHQFFLVMAFLFLASQVFWIYQIRKLGVRLIRNRKLRIVLGIAAAALYIFLFAYNFFTARDVDATSLTLKIALLEAPLRWWAFSSIAGFVLAIPFLVTGIIVDLFKPAKPNDADPQPERDLPSSPERRKFFSNVGMAAGVLPFAACGYGLLIGRVEFEKSFVRMKLPRLPREFNGFRIAQLSDIHIGPFMTSRDVRRVVEMTNALKPDLIVLTGDYVIWDPATQEAAVDSLSGLKAPFGVYGCLGNHEMWTHIEDSITRLFTMRDIKMLRHERTPIQVGSESLNLIGVDFQTHRPMGHRNEGEVRRYLEGVRQLTMPGQTNILLSHNPNTFDRAAEMGIDLSLAGHTHGGQVTLNFISPDLSIARLITPYVEGHFQKPGSQLYVNRGIGTIGVPIRFDAPPEITLFELVRA